MGVGMRTGTVVALMLVGKDACEEDWIGKTTFQRALVSFSHIPTDLSDVFIGRPVGVRGGVGGAAANKYLESNTALSQHPPRSSTYLVFEVVIVDDGFDLRNCILSRANSFWTI